MVNLPVFGGSFVVLVYWILHSYPIKHAVEHQTPTCGAYKDTLFGNMQRNIVTHNELQQRYQRSEVNPGVSNWEEC